MAAATPGFQSVCKDIDPLVASWNAQHSDKPVSALLTPGLKLRSFEANVKSAFVMCIEPDTGFGDTLSAQDKTSKIFQHLAGPTMKAEGATTPSTAKTAFASTLSFLLGLVVGAGGMSYWNASKVTSAPPPSS